MIIFSIGLPSATAETCHLLLAQLASSYIGTAVEMMPADSLEDLAINLLKSKSPQVIAVARQPGGRVREVLAELGSRFLLVMDHPRRVVAELVAGGGVDLPTAVRAVANSCAAVIRYTDLPGALLMWVETLDHAAAAVAICKHFGFELDPAAIAAVVGSVSGMVSSSPSLRAPGQWWIDLDEDHRALVGGALDAYGDLARSGRFGTITWERELFFNGDTPGVMASEDIDITGRARCLLYGPYVAVPPGAWTAVVAIGCSEEVAGIGITVEICSQKHLGRARLQPDGAGVFQATIAFTVGDADGPLEVRIFSERAAFDGRIGLSHVTLVPETRSRADDRARQTGAAALRSG